MAKVNGILDTALHVADIHKSAHFYQGLFGFQVLLESDRLIALDVAGRTTNRPHATPAGVIPPHDGTGS